MNELFLVVIFSLLNPISRLIQLGCNITQSLYKNSNFFGFELGWFAIYFIAVQSLEKPIAAFLKVILSDGGEYDIVR